MFFDPKILLGADTKLFDRHLKIEHASKRVAKFPGDRLRPLGDLERKTE